MHPLALLLCELTVIAVSWAKKLLVDLREWRIDRRFPYAVPFVINKDSVYDYQDVYDWVTDNVPKYEASVWVRYKRDLYYTMQISSVSTQIGLSGSTVETATAGEVRFKDQDKAIMFRLRFNG